MSDTKLMLGVTYYILFMSAWIECTLALPVICRPQLLLCAAAACHLVTSLLIETSINSFAVNLNGLIPLYRTAVLNLM